MSSLLAAGTAVAAAPPPHGTAVACTVQGAKVFAPALSPAQVCDRFIAALKAARIGSGDSLTVELRFLPRGLASAKVTRGRGAGAKLMPLYELAVSDRKFAADDIDRLAADVARGLRDTAGAGRG